MSIRFPSLLAALPLAICLQVTDAAAALNVTATQASGLRDQNVDVTFNVVSDGNTSDEADLSQISAYTFNLLWDPAALDFNSVTSNVPLEPFTSVVGSSVTNWIDFSFSSPANFSGGVSITANFHIRSDAAYGAHAIVFGDSQGVSNLTDSSFSSFDFSGVTQGGQMQVTVTQPSVAQVPEPLEVSMLLAGLGLVGAVVRRRNRQA